LCINSKTFAQSPLQATLGSHPRNLGCGGTLAATMIAAPAQSARAASLGLMDGRMFLSGPVVRRAVARAARPGAAAATPPHERSTPAPVPQPRRQPAAHPPLHHLRLLGLPQQLEEQQRRAGLPAWVPRVCTLAAAAVAVSMAAPSMAHAAAKAAASGAAADGGSSLIESEWPQACAGAPGRAGTGACCS
jgi:multisubunit Na+/H+ antiporter MnhG subunit